MNLFIGIITGSMDNAAQKQIESRDLEKRVTATTAKFHLEETHAGKTKGQFDLLSFNDDSIDKDELRFFLGAFFAPAANHCRSCAYHTHSFCYRAYLFLRSDAGGKEETGNNERFVWTEGNTAACRA
jgi:hypothetical protein